MNPLLRNMPPFPNDAAVLLDTLQLPPRLRAHLCLVHAVAVQLVSDFQQRWPQLLLDRRAISFGAATHDIGKIVHPAELSEPGQQHLDAGRVLLEGVGIAPTLARFTTTHERWRDDPTLGLDDLLVALADTCWKGTRDQTLEQRIADHIVDLSGRDPWDIFIAFDDLVEPVAADGDARLAWQVTFPI